jgi:hypothetical protein
LLVEVVRETDGFAKIAGFHAISAAEIRYRRLKRSASENNS